MGFPLSAVTYLAENLSGLKNFCPFSFIDRELLLFHFHFFSIFDRELSLFWKCVSNSIMNDFFFLGDPIVPSSEDRDGNSHPGSRFMVV